MLTDVVDGNPGGPMPPICETLEEEAGSSPQSICRWFFFSFFSFLFLHLIGPEHQWLRTRMCGRSCSLCAH